MFFVKAAGRPSSRWARSRRRDGGTCTTASWRRARSPSRMQSLLYPVRARASLASLTDPQPQRFREASGGAPSSRSHLRGRGAGGSKTARRCQVPSRRGLQAQQRPKPDEDGRERRHGAQDPGLDPHGGRAHSPGERVCVIPNASLRNDTLSHYHERLRAM
jgi:hypothetical protein